GNTLRRSRLPDELSVRLHGTNDVEFSAEHHRFANVEGVQIDLDSQFERFEEKSRARTKSSLRIPARRWWLGLVGRRQERSVYDCLRDRWTDTRETSGLRDR